MLRSPARRARMASCLARSSPCLRMENILRRTTYGSGLHDARQYFRHGLLFRSITRCTPCMPDAPRRRTNCAQAWRSILPSLLWIWLKNHCAANNALRLPPHERSVKNPEWHVPPRCTRTKNPCVRCDGWSIRQMPGVLDGLFMVGYCAGQDNPVRDNRQ